MKNNTRNIYLCLLSLFLVVGGPGCQVQQNTGGNANVAANTGANTAPVADSQPSPAAPTETSAAVTLPLLDALLTDEEFVRQAKTEVQLTDEEVERLRQAARSGMADHGEDDLDEGARSTRTSVAQAKREIDTILGRDRTSRFMSLIGRHMANGGETLAGKPNSIPSDTRVVVNSPAYRMDVFQDGNLVKSYKIGIGYPEFPLPTGMRTAKSIIFNPTWTPPDEPWVKGKFKPGQKVEAGSKLNPLGVIKIPIGAPSLIHGGKSPARLGTFASHGCVGLTNQQVQDVAVVFAGLAGERLTSQDVLGYQKNKTETKELQLSKQIPVELRYETIVVENGTLKIYRDVYEQGTNTEENLRSVLQVYGLSLDDVAPDLRAQILDGLKQMSLDATGKQPDGSPVDLNNTAKTAANANSSKVTKTIKGQKEIAIPIPQLSGKGYPAPKDLMAG